MFFSPWSILNCLDAHEVFEKLFIFDQQVVTAQYFVWFFCLLPLILPWSKMKLKWKGVLSVSIWTGAQLHWLMWGYLLEFKGKNVLIQLWLASILFLAANTAVLSLIIHQHKLSALFVLPETAVDNTKKSKKCNWCIIYVFSD